MARDGHPLILVISHPADPHATAVLERLRVAGHEAVLVDLSDLPHRAALSIDYADGPAPVVQYHRDGADPLDLTTATAAWWRRPQAADVSMMADRHVLHFAMGEWHQATAGLWQLLDHARWMNDPVRDDVASRKAFQLRVARECGFRTPRTLMTSDADRARAFIAANGMERTVFKTFSCTHQIWRETRAVRASDIEVLDSVRLAPVIFQEYIEGGVDVRVTVVGGQVFPMAIDVSGSDYPVDFRMSLGDADCRPIELPSGPAAALRMLMGRLGLAYGAVDFRLTPTGEFVFLEINTAGEFLFVEQRSGQPITRAVADWLSGDVA